MDGICLRALSPCVHTSRGGLLFVNATLGVVWNNIAILPLSREMWFAALIWHQTGLVPGCLGEVEVPFSITLREVSPYMWKALYRGLLTCCTHRVQKVNKVYRISWKASQPAQMHRIYIESACTHSVLHAS